MTEGVKRHLPIGFRLQTKSHFLSRSASLSKDQGSMVSVDKAVTARISREHIHFEILVDPEKAMDFKKGKPVPIEDVLAVQDVFKDVGKGERASAHEMEIHFKTSDVFKVAEEIIRHGEVQLTTEQRRRMLDEKTRQIADIISKQGINPQTKLPHPITRIMNAMEEARVHVDMMKPAQEQVEAVLDKISPIIPIAFQRLEVAIKVPAEHAGRLSSHIRNIATVRKEEWQGQYFFALIEIPAGMQSDIFKRLNDLTGGRVESKVVREIPLR